MQSTVQPTQSALHDLSREIVKRGVKAGATDVMGQVEIEKRRMVRFSNNSITVVKTWDVVSPVIYLGFGTRSIASRLGDTSTTTIDKTVNQMLAAVRALPESVESHLSKGPFQYEKISGLYDSKIPQLEGELTDYVDSAINASLEAGSKRVSGVLSSYHWRKFVNTSTDIEASTEQTMIELSMRSFAEDDASGQGISISTTLKDFDPSDAGEESGSFAKESLRPEPGKEGKHNVVFGPSIFGNLINSVAFSASAFAVEAGFSFLGDKLGQKVASEQMTLTDDRLRQNGPGAMAFDDEGHPSRANTLIEGGTFKTLVHDSRTAAKFKTSPTGNAVWDSDFGMIIPIPTCLVTEPGNMTRDELFEEAGDGLYITNTWYTRFQNYQTEDF